MRLIPINATPTQSFTFPYNGYKYDFVFRDNGNFMSYDISIDDVEVVQGFPFVIGQLLLPYKYMEVDGNFILSSEAGNEGADYTEFGDTQNLYYLTTDEAETARNEL
jgi:hypothetical protein